MTFEVGTRVRLGNLPEHTFNERNALEGAVGTVTEDGGYTYILVYLDEDPGLIAGQEQYFRPEELEAI